MIDKVYLITCNEKECMDIFKNNNIEDIVKEYPNKLIVTLGNRGVYIMMEKEIFIYHHLK